MRKTILGFLAATGILAAHGQMITDTVSTGGGYANQVWYSLPSDEQGNAPKTNWDLAFDASGFGSTILINSVTGTMIWNYPKDDIDGWATIDTNGLSTWAARCNSDTSWAYGALGRYADPSNSLDLDWGLYNMTTHVITGDSIYIIKLANGDYKKLWIETLNGGVYTFKYANLDGSSAQTATLDKTTYGGRNFGYYSLQSNTPVNREPASAGWDIVFGQYTTFIPSAYTVTGVLANKGVAVAECINVAGKDTFVTWASQTYHSEINALGYDWKTFTGSSYAIKDSLVYFIARTNGEIWKLIFRGFGGSSNGSYMFSKEKLSGATSVNGVAIQNIGTVLYPNPAIAQDAVLVYHLAGNVAAAKVLVSDITGRGNLLR